MSKPVAYVRVSSRAQDAKSQKAAIERLATAHGDVIDHWYSEKQSAKTTDRIQLKKLREDVATGGVSKIYVFRLDRFARSGIRDTCELLEHFRAHSTKVFSVADGFDLDGPAAEIIVAVMAWAAKMERLAINERISHARERLAAEGKPWGHPPSVTPALRETILRMSGDGTSIRKIAQAVGLPKSVIGRTVKAAA